MSLEHRAIGIGLRAALRYLERQGQCAPDDLQVRVTEACLAELPQALADAREALDVGMAAVAEETFAASMALAGIAAAKASLAAQAEQEAGHEA